MQINDKHYLIKKDFVTRLGELLYMAKPNLVRCEFKLGKELPTEKRYITEETPEGTAYHQIDWQPDGEWVVVTCENGHEYKINVTADSLATIAEEVFREMVNK